MPNLPAPLDVFVSSNDLQKSLTAGENAALAGGQLGSDVWYEYLTQDDDKVRPSHAALHGTVWHAGDPNAPMPPIDYGCFLPGTRISGVIDGASRAFYDGQAVEIITKNGARLSVTTNHPIPTENGLVAAGKIKPGCKVLIDPLQVVPVSGNHPDKDDQPTTVQQVFDFISKLWSVGTSRVAKTDFHGDGHFINGEIDVVGSYDLLRRVWDSHSAQDGRYGGLGFSQDLITLPHDGLSQHAINARLSPLEYPGSGSVGGGDLGLSLSGVHEAPLDGLRLRLIAELDASGQQCLGQIPSTDSNCFGERIDGLPLMVIRNHLGDIDWRKMCCLSLGSGPSGHARLLEADKDGLRLDAKLQAEFSIGGTGLVQPDEVVEVRFFKYSGHVYDFRSPVGHVIANGVTASNCRCFIKYVARPGSEAARHLPPARSEPTTQAEAWGAFMDKNVPGWSGMLQAAEKLPAGERLGALSLAIEKATGRTAADSRKLARMAFAATQDPVSLVETDPRKVEQSRLAKAAEIEKLNAKNDAAPAAKLAAEEAAAKLAAAKAAEEAAAKAKKLSDDLDAAFAKQQKQAELNAAFEAQLEKDKEAAKYAAWKENQLKELADNKAAADAKAAAAAAEAALKPATVKAIEKLKAKQAAIDEIYYGSATEKQKQALAKKFNAITDKIDLLKQGKPIAKKTKLIPDTKPIPAGEISEGSGFPPGKAHEAMPETPTVSSDGLKPSGNSLRGVRAAATIKELIDATQRVDLRKAGSSQSSTTQNRDAVDENIKLSTKLMASFSEGQRLAVKRFSNGYDYYIRLYDRTGDAVGLRAALLSGADQGKGPMKDAPGNQARADAETKNVINATRDLKEAMKSQEVVKRWPIIYRGHQNMKEAEALAMMQLKELSFASMSSTSNTMERSLSFASPAGGRVAILFRMRDTLGMPIKQMSDFSHENEVLITVDQKWRVLSVTKDSSTSDSAPRFFVDMEPVEKVNK
jgi:hypothetical protein